MPRRGYIAKRDVLPDPIYNSKVVTKLINNIMLDGKKSVAQGIVYDAFDIIKEKEGKNPLEVFEAALENIMPVLKEMVSQTKELKFNEKGLIEKGVIIRHLMLPGLLFDSKKVIDRIYNTFGDKVYISLMNQYIPMYNASNYPEINKKLNPKHYDSLIDYATNIGVVNGFIQDEGSNSTEFVPDFNLQGVLKK